MYSCRGSLPEETVTIEQNKPKIERERTFAIAFQCLISISQILSPGAGTMPKSIPNYLLTLFHLPIEKPLPLFACGVKSIAFFLVSQKPVSHPDTQYKECSLQL